MADTMEYKCPSCGGSMEFDSKTQKLKCPFCATEVGIEEWEDVQEEQAGMQQGDTCWEAMGGDSSWTREETANMAASPVEERLSQIKRQVQLPAHTVETR